MNNQLTNIIRITNIIGSMKISSNQITNKHSYIIKRILTEDCSEQLRQEFLNKYKQECIDKNI